jgi:hypothetical protein
LTRFLSAGGASLLAVFAFTLLACGTALSFEGPLQVRNQFPLFLTLSPPYLEKASPEDSLSVNLSYSSVYMVRDSSLWSVKLDMEVAEIMIRCKKEVLPSIEVGVEVPVLSFNSGFLDGFLNSYHSSFGFSDYGRRNRPDNEFLYEVQKQGSLVLQGKNGSIGIGDIRFTVKKSLMTGNPALSLKADLELPTGKASEGFGNGSIDGGVSILVDIKISERVMAYANLGVIFPGDLRGREKIELRESFYGGTGIEASVFEKVSLLGQVLIQSSPYPKTGVPSIDRPAVLLSLGGRYSSGKHSIDLSLTEDPNTAGAPDFTASLSFKKRF